ncbi:MAG: glycosyltransferase family 9 protein [Alphaproteobacteria bacterium]|nr:glycosyltransferase family 9 protein [Alphaproteobacteria bacterium]MCA0450327.1 lipopolysaccharide heptosyltransferase family protein [Pseudomonadota bacterium]
MPGYSSILIYVGLDLVGDGLLKLPFARRLRANWPEARIVWCAGKGPSVYATTLKPLVDGLIDETIENAGFGSSWGDLLTRPLGGRDFDLVIDTQRRFSTSLAVRRVRHRRFVSGAAGWFLSDGKPRDTTKPRSMDAQLSQLIEAAGGDPNIATAPLRLPAQAVGDARTLLPDGQTYVVLAPGAGNREKCWPLERFVELGHRLSARGIVPVFQLGPNETDWVAACRAVPNAILPIQDAIARRMETAPALTIALAQRCKAAVANDAGGGHMLAAGDVGLVSLFGPTDPAKFAPAAQRLTVIRAQTFGAETMDAIPLDAVEKALATYL